MGHRPALRPKLRQAHIIIVLLFPRVFNLPLYLPKQKGPGRSDSSKALHTKKKAIAQLLDIVQERLGDKEMIEAAVIDINAPEEGDMFASMLKERFGPSTLHRAIVSPVVGTHVDPGTIGIAFYGEG